MATINGTCSLGRGYSFYANVYETSVDDVNNQSTVKYEVYVKNGNMRTESSNWTFNAKIDGSNVYNATGQTLATNTVDFGAAKKVFEGSTTITHNQDGTKTITFSAKLSRSYYSSYDPGECNLSGNVTLSNTKRNSVMTLSSNNFNIGDIIQATITQYVNTYHQNLYMVIGGSEVLIQSSATGTIDIETYLLRNQIYQQIPNAKYYDSEFRLKTYDGNNNLIGTDTKTFRANVVDSNPLFNIAYEDTNATTTAITQNNQQIIQNNSTLRFKFTNASAQHYASLSSYAITINGVTRTGSISSTSLNVDWGVLNLSDNTNATVSVTDSRGFTTTKTVALTILEWKLPTAIISLNRKQNYYTETDINADASYSSLDSKNTITIQYRIKKTSTSTWGSWNNLTDNQTTTFNADNQYSWDVQIKVQDSIGTTTYNVVLPIGMAIFFIDRLKRSLGVNCFPSQSNSIELNGSSIFDLIYPVGSIYLSINNVNPGTLFGGTWVQVSEGRALFGAGSITTTYNVNGNSTDYTDTYVADTNYAAGLPNLVGTGHYADNNGDWSGALYNVGSGNLIGDGSASGTRIGLDASRNKSIYGRSNTVQPNAYAIYVWKRTQ